MPTIMLRHIDQRLWDAVRARAAAEGVGPARDRRPRTDALRDEHDGRRRAVSSHAGATGPRRPAGRTRSLRAGAPVRGRRHDVPPLRPGAVRLTASVVFAIVAI